MRRRGRYVALRGKSLRRTQTKRKGRTTGDLGVETVLLGDLTDEDEAFWSDFSTCDTRDDGEGPVPLDVGEEATRAGQLRRKIGRAHV